MSDQKLIDDIVSKTNLPGREIKSEITQILKENGLNWENPSLEEMRKATSIYLHKVFDSLLSKENEVI